MMTVLIVGYGSIARKHISALKSLNEQIEILLLRSGKGTSDSEEYINIYDLSETSRTIDFAIISNPTILHYKFIALLLGRGVTLFIEKPPLASLSGALDLISKVVSENVKTYVACNLRFHPCIMFLKEYVSKNSDNRINEVNIYCGSYLPDWRPGQSLKNTYSADKEMGGGVHLDLFHEIDYAHWVFGMPLNSLCVKRCKSSLNINAVDYANYILQYRDFAISIILNYYRRDPRRSIEILFEDCTWTIDLLSSKIVNDKKETIFESEKFNFLDTYKDQMAYFVNCMKKNVKPMNSFEESITILETCLCDEQIS